MIFLIIQLSVIFSVTIYVSGNDNNRSDTNEDAYIDKTRKYETDIGIDSYSSRRPGHSIGRALNSHENEDSYIDQTRKYYYDTDRAIESYPSRRPGHSSDRALNSQKNEDSDINKTSKYEDAITSYERSKPDYFSGKPINFDTDENSDVDKTRKYIYYGNGAINNYDRSRRYYYDQNTAFDDYDRTKPGFYDATRTTHNFALSKPDYYNARKAFNHNTQNGMNYYNGNNRPNYQDWNTKQEQMYGNRYPDFRNNPSHYGIGNTPQLHASNSMHYRTNALSDYHTACIPKYSNRGGPHYDYTRTSESDNSHVENAVTEASNQPETENFDVHQAPELYTKYLQDYEKSYATMHELLCHYDIFKNSLAEINNFRDTDPDKKYGLNFISDWSDEDFEKKFNSDVLIKHKQMRYVLR